MRRILLLRKKKLLLIRTTMGVSEKHIAAIS